MRERERGNIPSSCSRKRNKIAPIAFKQPLSVKYFFYTLHLPRTLLIRTAAMLYHSLTKTRDKFADMKWILQVRYSGKLDECE